MRRSATNVVARAIEDGVQMSYIVNEGGALSTAFAAVLRGNGKAPISLSTATNRAGALGTALSWIPEAVGMGARYATFYYKIKGTTVP